MLGQYEVWQLINLTRDTHPIHLHLDPFQIVSRRPIRCEIPQDGIEDFGLAASVTLGRDPNDQLGHPIDDNERGLKDTIASTPTRSSKSPSASPPTPAATCTTARSSNTKTAT